MKFSYSILFAFSLVLLAACSTEKNTLINRSYHGMTAHYNGYFNANELLKQSMTSYRAGLKEDYYSQLPLTPMPDEEAVKGMLPAIDTAIAKCTEVISKHSMPTASEPSKKRSEHNKWIDENWLTIGISNYYKRDYEGAMKNFQYINKFFSNDPSNYTAAIWMAKTCIEQKNYTEASLILKNLDADIEELDQLAKQNKKFKLFSKEKSSSKSKKKSKKKSKTADDKAQEKAEFPKKSRFLFELTKCELALAQEDLDKAIESLENSLKFCKKSADKARIHYILAQLNAQKPDNEKAKYHYTKVLKYNANFDMNFNARINRALMGGDSKIKEQLQKMLRDEKNAEYKDQIYYALADIALKEGKKDEGIELLHKSILFSTTNTRQKAMAYEKLGNMRFEERNYVLAQKYYDSCANVLPDNYPNGDYVRNKALKLKDLVTAVETAQYEDSVQRIAALSPEEQKAFAENLVKKIKEDEKRKKEQEALRLKEIQAQQLTAVETGSSNKFFWNSPKLKSEGLESFRKLWGARENADDWRRSEKIVEASFVDPDADTNELAAETEVADSLTPESLLAKLPSSDSLMSQSQNRMLNAYYDAGIIYKDQLNELDMASKQFETVIGKNIPSKYNVLSLYQLYKINETKDAVLSTKYKNEILINYPESDYANYLRDPDFFVKRKELEKLAESDYIKVLDRYNRGLYSIVLNTTEPFLQGDKTNPYRAKYILLNALSVGQTSDDKQKMVPILKLVKSEYAGTDEEKKADELLGIIEKGYSKYEEKVFAKKYIYADEEREEHWVLIFMDKKSNSALEKGKVVDYNKEFFGKDKLNVSSKIYGDDQSVIVVKTFTKDDALHYINEFKKSKKYVTDLQDAKIICITQNNLKILFETQKLEEYELFYSEFY